MPAPSGSGVAGCEPGVVCGGALAAGAYVSEAAGARIAFTLDDHDWSGIGEIPGVGFGLLLADFPDAAISALAFGGEVFTDACDPTAGMSTIGTTPTEFVAMLAARTGVTADPPLEVEVGGRPGLQVDLRTDVDEDCAATGDNQVSVWPLPPAGPFDLYDQERARMIAVDGGSATVILVAEARSEGGAVARLTGTGAEDYDRFLGIFTDLLETMTITPL
jgi:hypothetical protein